MIKVVSWLSAVLVVVLAFPVSAQGAPAGSTAALDLLTSANIQFDGAAAGDELSTVDGAGDVNGDGLADVVLGAHFASNNGRTFSGSAYVVFGQDTTTTIDLASLGSAGFQIDGGAAFDEAGVSVAGAQDVNGDGLDDVVIGAQAADNNGRGQSGSAYVIFGRTATTTIDLASLGSAGYRIDGAASGNGAGLSVAGGNDVNGDGLADVVVGAPFAGNNGRGASGSAYVVFGQDTTTTIDLASLGSAGYRIDGAAGNDLAGNSVAMLGDVNNDGIADVALGAPFSSNNDRFRSGSGYVVFGQSASPTIDLASLGSAGFQIDGAAEFDVAGAWVGSGGDVNGDGAAEVIVGAPFADSNGRIDSGSAYVVFGGNPATVDLASLGQAGIQIDGAVAGDEAGIAVDGADDVNRDGRDDVIVGAPFADNNGRTNSGSAYVVFGQRMPGTLDLASLGPAGFRIDGAAAGDEAGLLVAGAGDLNRDRRADVLVSSIFADNNGRSSSGSAYLVFGRRCSGVKRPRCRLR